MTYLVGFFGLLFWVTPTSPDFLPTSQTLETSLPWSAELSLDVANSGSIVIGSPKENMLWLVDAEGRVLSKKSFEDDGFTLVSFNTIQNGGMRVFLNDETYRPVVLELDISVNTIRRYDIEKELIFNQNIQFAKKAPLLLSRGMGTYDAEFPERKVSQALLNLKGEKIKSFSEHFEGGRLYVNADYAMLLELLRERVRGFYHPRTVVNFDDQNRIIFIESHNDHVLKRFDPETHKYEDLIKFEKGTSQETLQRRAVARFFLEERIQRKLPGLQLEKDAKRLLDEVAKSKEPPIKNADSWGVFSLGNNVYAVVTHVDFQTGDQTCMVYRSHGKPRSWKTKNWALLSPMLVPKIARHKDLFYVPQLNQRKKTLSIVVRKMEPNGK